MDSPSPKPPFDPAVAAATLQLIRGSRASSALAVLSEHEPLDRRSRIEFELMSLRAKEQLGRYREAMSHALRALRLTSRCPELRPKVRSWVAVVQYRAGEFGPAERQVRRGLAQLHTEEIDPSVEAWLINILGLIHRRRGNLGMAIQTYEQALVVVGRKNVPENVGAVISANLALALMHRGELERAGVILQPLLQSAQLESRQSASLFQCVVFHALQCENWDAAERALSGYARALDCGDLRQRLLSQEYRARILIARGRAADALPILEEELRTSLEIAPLGDLVPSAAHFQAEALLQLGRAGEALQKAQLAARAGRRADVLELAAGLRLVGKCHATLQRPAPARAAFAEALSVLQGTEFILERRRLETAIRDSGLSLLDVTPTVESPRPSMGARSGRRAGPHRIPLRGGRTFATCDDDLVEQIHRAASHRLPVLLEGETGTGKELVAHLVHELGPEPDAPFIVVDCPTLPENLVEAELFGATRGAYTGSASDRRGLVSAADGGTLFFDEVPELSLPVQSKLLRLLQEGTYRRVGEDRLRRVSARFVAATNRDPQQLVRAGLLKPDLYFRLNGQSLRLRPLRERRDDIEVLAIEFAGNAGLGGIARSAWARLLSYSWPGNIRQLEMLIQLAASTLGAGCLLGDALLDSLPLTDPDVPSPASLRARRIEAERALLQKALEDHHGSVSAVARAFAMSRQGLYKALRRTGLAEQPPPTAGLR